MELRWLAKSDGTLCLQYRDFDSVAYGSPRSVSWRTVPLVDEEGKVLGKGYYVGIRVEVIEEDPCVT